MKDNLFVTSVFYPLINRFPNGKAEKLGNEVSKIVSDIEMYIKGIRNVSYGSDLKTVALVFYVLPDIYLKDNLKEIDNYMRSELLYKINIIVEKDFFNKTSEEEKKDYLKTIVVNKLELLAVKAKKIDTDILKLIEDVKIAFNVKKVLDSR